MRLAAFALAAVLLAAPLRAADAPAFHDMDGGWHEAWIGVSDLDRMRTFFEEVAGWTAVKAGKIDKASLGYFSDEADRGRYLVLRQSDYPQGWVRLIELEGASRKIIRPHAQAWDTGGLFSIMTRTADAERNLADAEKIGWTAYNVPYDFGFGDLKEFGELKLRNLILRGPDGVNVSTYEWVKPKRADATPAGSVSKAFNSMQMVADLDAAVTFYVDGLGFRLIHRDRFLDPAETPTNFALPVNHATKVARNYAIVIPEGAHEEAGRVELMQFEGFKGRDLAARADLAGLGITTLVFPTSDLGRIEARIREKGLRLVRAPAAIALPPWGAGRALTVASPEGAFMTFFEPAANERLISARRGR